MQEQALQAAAGRGRLACGADRQGAGRASSRKRPRPRRRGPARAPPRSA